MRLDLLASLHRNGLLTDAQHSFLTRIYDKSYFSLFYELKTMMYLGVLLFTSGIGIIVYKNIDTIGHQAIIAFLTALMAGCFWYVTRQRLPYSNDEVQSPGALYDYLLLLGCLLLGTIIGYLQFQYKIFGKEWELSALIPALVCLAVAYLYDHRGVLSLGIAGLASWLGLTVSPVEMMKQGIFADEALIVTGLIFGTAVVAIAFALHVHGIKRHFTFTSLTLGANILFISCLAALFTMHPDWLYFILLLLCCSAGIFYARKEQSFLFLLLSCVYGYVGLTYMFRDFFFGTFGISLYFILSCGALVYFIFHYKTFLGRP